MKKTFKTLAAILVAAVISPNFSNAQAVEQGTIIIDGYYGFPNLYTNVFKTAYANSATAVDLNVGGIGPVGGRFEYLVSDKFGIGLDIGFNNSIVTYTESGTTSTGTPTTYEYTFKTSKLGIMPTFNFHFLDNNDNLDVYGVLGIGYGSRKYDFSSTDPDYTPATIKSLIPVASKIGVGMRYFFTDNIGANLALGFGQGGLVNAGISVKF